MISFHVELPRETASLLNSLTFSDESETGKFEVRTKGTYPEIVSLSASIDCDAKN